MSKKINLENNLKFEEFSHLSAENVFVMKHNTLWDESFEMFPVNFKTFKKLKNSFLETINNHELLKNNPQKIINHQNNDGKYYSNSIYYGSGYCVSFNKLYGEDDYSIDVVTLKDMNRLTYLESHPVYEWANKHFKPLLTDVSNKNNKINIITKGKNGLYLKPYDLNDNKNEFDVKDLYNDDFKEISEHIINHLENKHNGIALLHGVIGSGKTSYIRYLIRILKNKKIIYFPPEMAQVLSSPDIINFLSEYDNSIIVIEDAENVLRPRGQDNASQAVSNILNMSDGLMSDAFKLQFVCTFNTNIEKIDQALLRPGRLIANYKFEKLTKDKTNNLVKKLYGKDVDPEKEEMTLAEIFNMEKKHFVSKKKEKSKIGFV